MSPQQIGAIAVVVRKMALAEAAATDPARLG
jgi:hypothetical protein